MPGSVRYARDFAQARRVDNVSRMNRLYVAEGSPSVTGAMADHKRITRTSDIAPLVQRLAVRLGVGQAAEARTESDAWLDAVTAELTQNRGASIVIAGDRQPPLVHALVHTINDALGNHGKTIELARPVAYDPGDQLQSLRALTMMMNAGQVDTLIMLGGNPVYNAPIDLGFGNAPARVP